MPEKRASPRLNIRHVNPAVSTPLIASAGPLASPLSPNPCLACLILLQRKPYLCVYRFARPKPCLCLLLPTPLPTNFTR
jgi:hypothetical protein